MTHLLEQEVAALKEKVAKLLKDISLLRKSESELRGRNRQAEERIGELQMELKKAKETRNIKAKDATESR
jgi:peptidoglycan hydrolase CwlO-like protein